jgi:uncharacterized membrane protein
MLRVLVTIACAGLLVTACATAPSDLDSDAMVSTVAAPAPPPPPSPASAPAPAPDNADDLGDLMGEPVGESTVTSGTMYEQSGAGRGSVQVPRVEGPELTIAEVSSGSSGFVYPVMGAAFAGTRPETPYVLEAHGEAPYWRATAELYEVDGAVFARFALIAADEPPINSTLARAPDFMAGGFRRYVSATPDGPRVSAAYQAGPCVDRTGIRRGYFASIRVNGVTFEGCARETGGQWDWSRDLLDRYDQIMMCLNEIPGAVAAIDAYSPSEENTAVRVIDGEQVRHECLIVNDNQRLASTRELEPTEVHLNEGRTVFFSAMPETRDQCRRYETVMDANANLLGVLAHDICQNPRAHVEGPLTAGES